MDSSPLLHSFPAELAKDVPSKGDFQNDYLSFCANFNIIPCPYFISFDENSNLSAAEENSPNKVINCVRISNCIVDLASWRAMLLAISSTGSKILSLNTHNIVLTPNHILDLITTIEKIGTFSAVSLEYINGDLSLLYESLKSLLSGNASIDYISLKGNKLNDSFLLDVIPTIQSNLTLQMLNLTENLFSDVSVSDFFKMLRLNISLKEISFAKNLLGSNGVDFTQNLDQNSESSSSSSSSSPISSTSLSMSLAALLTGGELPVTADDEAFTKNLVKIIGDKNKAIKEVNKKRKKANVFELNELATPENRVFKIDGQNVIINKTISTIDISRNNALLKDNNFNFIQTFLDEIVKRGPAATTATATASSTTTVTFVCKDALFDEKKIEDLINGPIATTITPPMQFIF